MSRINLNLAVGVKRSPSEDGERIDMGVLLSITYDLTDIGKLLETKAWRCFTALRRVWKACLSDDSSE